MVHFYGFMHFESKIQFYIIRAIIIIFNTTKGIIEF